MISENYARIDREIVSKLLSTSIAAPHDCRNPYIVMSYQNRELAYDAKMHCIPFVLAILVEISVGTFSYCDYLLRIASQSLQQLTKTSSSAVPIVNLSNSSVLYGGSHRFLPLFMWLIFLCQQTLSATHHHGLVYHQFHQSSTSRGFTRSLFPKFFKSNFHSPYHMPSCSFHRFL